MPGASRRRPPCFAVSPPATCAGSFDAATVSWCFSTSLGCSPRTSASCSSDHRRSPRGMPDAPADDVRGRYAALAARLDAADASTDKAALKADIIELFRAVERELADL